MKHFRSVVSLLMVFVLCFGMIPCAFADEITTPTAPQSGEGSASEAVPPNTDQTPPPEESAAPPEESTEPPSEEATEPMEEDPTDETTLPEELDDLDSDDRLLGAEAYASTQKSIMLFDFADNGDYTTRLNYQVSCTYKPNGSGTTRTAYVKNMGWHFARYGGVAHADEPLYCIEPWRNYAASTSGNSVDRDVTLNGSGSTTGSNVWYALPSARREAIGLILLYSDQQWDHSISVTSVKKDSNPNVPLRVATQILIYEIVCGLRDPSSFNRNSSNECGTSGDVFYAAASDSVSGFSSCYNSLVSAIQSAKKIPSFCGSSSSNAPTIQLSGDTGSVYDSNGVLSAFSFSNGNGARFSKSGNTLNITKTGDISESTVFTATRYLPSASNSSYNIWYMSGSSYQTTISLYNAGSNGLNAYFKIKAPSLGNISLTKTTEDGTNLSGWKFGIYSDSACTKLVSGPYTTNSSGKLSVTGLNAGTYYVKELGNTDSSIDALYSCASTNPQRVTIASGQTASVSFYNKRNTGSVQLVNKTDNYFVKAQLNEGEGVYYVTGHTENKADATHFVPVKTGDTKGRILIKGLEDDTYSMTEVRTDSGYVLLKQDIEVVISQKESADSCTVYASDTLGLIQNDPRYAQIIQSDANLKNIPQKHLEHKLRTASATVSGKKVNMVEDNGSTNAEAPLTVVNTRGFDLPKTGDNGTMMFTVVGILLMAGAVSVIALVSRKKRSV